MIFSRRGDCYKRDGGRVITSMVSIGFFNVDISLTLMTKVEGGGRSGTTLGKVLSLEEGLSSNLLGLKEHF